MALQKGEASALMTKLINESLGYSTLLAGMFVLSLMIFNKGNVFIGTVAATIFACCSTGLIFYWIDHLSRSCEHIRKQHPQSRMALFHSLAIFMILLFSYIGALVIAIITLLETFILKN